MAGGNIESAIFGAFQAVAFFGIGEALGHTDPGFLKGNHGLRIVAHAATGCVMSGVQGGSCGSGAAGAGFAAFAGPVIDTGSFGADVAAHAVAGGLGAMAGGGKFGNGALTGAFGYLFNRAANGCSNCAPDEAAERDARMAGSGARLSELAVDAAKFIAPGGAAFECISSTCGMIGWGIAAVDALPGAGKVASFGGRSVIRAWDKATFNTVSDSIRYHYGKHGSGQGFASFTHEAQEFLRANKTNAVPHNLKDGSVGLKIRTASHFGIYTQQGKIVTYGPR